MCKDPLIITTYEEAKELINLAIYAGQLLISNGAEIYRAEDTVMLMCESRKNLHDVDVFAFNSAIFVSCEFQGDTITVFKNVETSKINLERIQMINTFSRKFVRKKISTKEAFLELKEISKTTETKKVYKIIFTGLCSASFAVLFGGHVFDFFYSFIVGSFLALFLYELESRNFPLFAEIFLASLFVSSLALVGVNLFKEINMDKIIIAAIMPLVPGLTVTTALRDVISGDYVSGIIGVVKGVFTAFAIALGVGVILNLQLLIGGV